MRLHGLQHAPFEGLGIIEDWAKAQGAAISVSQLFHHDTLPDPERFDWLVVMGGPMGIYEHDEHPWLVAEKQLIRHAAPSARDG